MMHDWNAYRKLGERPYPGKAQIEARERRRNESFALVRPDDLEMCAVVLSVAIFEGWGRDAEQREEMHRCYERVYAQLDDDAQQRLDGTTILVLKALGVSVEAEG
jgi:hypothetical protein